LLIIYLWSNDIVLGKLHLILNILRVYLIMLCGQKESRSEGSAEKVQESEEEETKGIGRVGE